VSASALDLKIRLQFAWISRPCSSRQLQVAVVAIPRYRRNMLRSVMKSCKEELRQAMLHYHLIRNARRQRVRRRGRERDLEDRPSALLLSRLGSTAQGLSYTPSAQGPLHFARASPAAVAGRAISYRDRKDRLLPRSGVALCPKGSRTPTRLPLRLPRRQAATAIRDLW